MYQQLSGILKEEVIGENIHQINREKKLYTNGILPTILKQERRSEKIGVMNRTNTTVYITGFPIFDDNHELKYAVAHDRNIQQLEIVKDQLLHLKEVQAKTENEVQYLRTQQIKQVDLIFKSPQMYQALSTALAVAPTDASVLITGESGTGKEDITNQIYQASSRFNKPFQKINCAAIPETLMESELFGYVPGAFTGASKNGKTGIFEMANGGTLMLDEIGEMSMPMQTKLLRVLQNHEVTKVGSSKAIPIDVRIIAATNRNLLECIKEKTFREDLYYRLNVVPISLAPLRERKEDIDVLVHHFLDVFNKKYNKQVEIYSDALHLMTAYNWPGNIRELENVMERAVLLVGQDGLILPQHLPRELHSTHCPFGPEAHKGPVEPYTASGTLQDRLDELERACITDALARHKGHMGHAAQALGLTERVMALRMKKHGISYKDFRQH